MGVTTRCTNGMLVHCSSANVWCTCATVCCFKIGRNLTRTTGFSCLDGNAEEWRWRRGALPFNVSRGVIARVHARDVCSQSKFVYYVHVFYTVVVYLHHSMLLS